MSRLCVVTVGVGGWYPRGVDRLADSLRTVGFDGTFLGWKDTYPKGCPPHSQIQKAFKLYAVKEALHRGATRVLWLDASAWVIKPLTLVQQLIDRDGHMFIGSDATIGGFSSDASLEHFGITREQAFKIPSIQSGFVGLDMTKKPARDFFDLWWSYLPVFHAPRVNVNGNVSSDPRVKGHRPDQTPASYAVHKLGLQVTPHDSPGCPVSMALDKPIRPDVEILARGM